MSCPDLDVSSVDKVTDEQLEHLEELADKLLERHFERMERHSKENGGKNSRDKLLIVPIVGAGASLSAGIPASGQLREKIHEKLEASGTNVIDILDQEASDRFRNAHKGIKDENLSLFEFASVVSQLKWGRDEIYEVVREEINRAMCTPLAYELLAHLAKHAFVDHFISLNFDELLDRALRDEIEAHGMSQKLYHITSSDDVPGEEWLRQLEESSPVLLFKPFGSLSRDRYRLTSDETKRYGANRVWDFMVKDVFSKKDNLSANNPEVCLLLVGYKAEEEAFREFLEELHRDGNREVTIFSINIDETLSHSLTQDKTSPTHIRLRADLAFDLLLQITRHKYVDKHEPEGWVPVDRHRVLSYGFRRDSDEEETQRRRFEVELILQAVKSPGFFNIEAVALTHRIEEYDEHASEVIKRMRREAILEPGPGSSEDDDFPIPPENYRLNCDNEDLAQHILRLSGLQPEEHITEWTVQKSSGSPSGWQANSDQVRRQVFLETCLDTITAASHIEVSHQVHPATDWLFDDPKRLQSVAELHETTIKLFDEFLNKANGQIELYGVWDTAEWLFHKDGWAWDKVGEKVLDLLSQDRLKMSLVLAKVPSEEISTEREAERAKRAQDVRNLISNRISNHRRNCARGACEDPKEKCRLLELDWWQHNRVLTLLRCNDGQQAGIYMRRRHAAPLVAPVRVDGKEDCDVLHNIFRVYQQRVINEESDQ